jgi:hypothetical protein
VAAKGAGIRRNRDSRVVLFRERLAEPREGAVTEEESVAETAV